MASTSLATKKNIHQWNNDAENAESPMKRNEKNLLILAGVLFSLVLVVRVVPMLLDYYARQRDEVALLGERIERSRTLIVETSQWREREALKRAEITDLQSWIFEGTDPNLVSSSVQRMLRQVVQNTAGVELREIDVPRYSSIDDWLVVEQDMDFALTQEAILPFLNALQNSRPRLQIAAFNVSHNRRQFTGRLTVVGFSRAKRVEPVAAPITTLPATSDATSDGALL
jgi:hypothetical protein